MAAKKMLSAKSDYIFKLLFGDERNIDCLRSFLASVLKTPISELTILSIVDPFKQRESSDDKLSVMDVKVDTGEQVIDIEIQVKVYDYLRKRLGFYLASMVTEQLGSGDRYGALRPAVCILIVNDELLSETRKPHSTIMMCDVEEHFVFDDLQRMDILELSKLPADGFDDPLINWLRFIKSENEEEMEMLARTDPAINKAYGVIKELSEDEATRLRNESRLKFLRDQWARESGAMEKGLREGRQEGLREGRQEGLREGRQEGLREGRQEGLREGRREGMEEAMINAITDLNISDPVYLSRLYRIPTSRANELVLKYKRD